MSAQVFTLGQVCKEHNGWLSSSGPDIWQPAPAKEASSTIDRKYRLHEVLRHLITTLTLVQPLDEMLFRLATLTMQAMEVDLCVVLLKDQERDPLRMYTCAPDLSDKGIVVQPVSVSDHLWEQMRASALQGQLPQLPIHELESLNPLKNVQYETLVPIPLIAGTEYIGLLNCYGGGTIDYSDDDVLMLHTIANQTALAIKHRHCVEEDLLAQKSFIRAFISSLCDGNCDETLRRRAYFLGYDLARPHAIALLELSEVAVPGKHEEITSVEERFQFYRDVIGQVKRSIQEYYPGSLIDERDNRLICLVCHDDEHRIEQFNACLDEVVRQMRCEYHAHLFAGIGNVCYEVSDYPRSYTEAGEALQVSQCLSQEGCSSHFNALGVYRYLYKFAHEDTLRDQYQEQIATIVEYDRRKKTNLLDTLEIYLEYGGSVAKTSAHLKVHRNTLLQRLERLQKLCALDLEQLQNWLPLLVALKVHKLRTHSGHPGKIG